MKGENYKHQNKDAFLVEVPSGAPNLGGQDGTGNGERQNDQQPVESVVSDEQQHAHGNEREQGVAVC